VTGIKRVAVGSLVVGGLVLAAKAAAWWLTGSTGLYSDALESTVNVAAAALALIAIRLAMRPADAHHPYGHDKAELFAAIVEGVLIVVAALSVWRESWMTWRHPEPLAQPGIGMVLNFGATIANGAWAAVLFQAAKRYRSAALDADGRHLLADVVTSIAVLIGVGLAVTLHIPWLDPLAAALAGAHILWSGIKVISRSVDGLMDAAPPAAVVARIRDLVSGAATGAIEAHDLRMRLAGRQTFMDFHLVVPASMSVADAHDICDHIENTLRSEIADLRISIHVEPEGKAKHHGVLVL
jgi:cation diffusion facilitator family transporter